MKINGRKFVIKEEKDKRRADALSMDFSPKKKAYKEGEPCKHAGCLHHVTHPCEGCGRIAGHGIREI